MKTLLVFATLLMSTIAPVLAAEGPIRHVVSFRFKKDATPEQIKKVEDAFAALKGKIKEIDGFEWGTNVSPEKHAKDFSHLWIATFKTPADRDAYLVHPDHKAFAAGLKGLVDDVFVIDFVPQK